MSKSLGNLVLVSQALERAPAAAVRLYMASHAYRRDWDFSWSGLARAARLVERVRALLEGEARGAGAGPRGATPDASRELMAEFGGALADDLDTPRALRALRVALRQRDAPAVRSMLGILAGTASLT